MSERRIPVAGPWITELEVEYVADAARNAWYERAGEYPHRFEKAFAEHVNRRFAISLPSCTAGIHLVLAALGIGPGDEVIVPDATWIASAAPITYVGATTVFADVDRSTWCLDVDGARDLVSSNTKAIVAVDLYGGTPELQELERLASDHGLALIEDAAEAVGSLRGGRPAGNFGLASVFSFHGSKTLTTGEGGMIVTDDEELFNRMLVLRDHGRPVGDSSFFNGEIAFKYKMSALQAALGLAQLERLPDLVEKKRQIFGWYDDALAGLDGVILNAEPLGTVNSYWMVTMLLDNSLDLHSSALQRHLHEQGMDTRPFFHPLSSLPAFSHSSHAEESRRRNYVAYDLAHRGLNLPSALVLEECDVARVADAVRTALVNAGSEVPKS